MRIEKINLYQAVQPLKTNINNNENTSAKNRSIETSIYNQKGLTIPFCRAAKGQNALEEGYIKFLRKVREGRRRKFDENEIYEIVSDLRKINTKENKLNILEDVISISQDAIGEKPEKKLFMRLVNLMTNRSEIERHALCEFAENEIKNAVVPLKAFAEIPQNKRDGLFDILTTISKINHPVLYKSDEARVETIESLYELARFPIYAHVELSNLNKTEAAEYMVESIKTIKADRNSMQKADNYICNAAKEKVISAADKITYYMIDNFLK